ncbi:hypothetical protein L7F22_064618 [Adiantum nelumboides]|nr:hypothetical protein [Adiantum nelumboides]
MQTAGMLLRSSSTSLLDHYLLAAPFCHTEPSLDTRNEGIVAAGDGQSPLCAFLHTSRGGGPHLPLSSHPPFHLDFHMKFSGWPSSSDSPVGPPSSNLMRKAQSENDLCSLGGGGSLTPARVAANTLLQDSLVDDCASGSVFESYNPSCYLPHMKKGRELLPLSRRMSLGSLPSELPSVFFSDDPGDSDFAILEEGELSPSLSSVAIEVGEDRETQACLFDKFALPVNETVLSNHDDGVLLNNSHVQGKSSSGIPEKNIMQSVASGRSVRMSWTGYDEADMVASPSGRQELGVEHRQSQYANVLSRNDMVLTLTREVCGPISSSNYVYDGDKLEIDCNGGAGGRGARPRLAVSGGGGGGGGGGDAGGRGGGSSEVADQHYQLMLQKHPGNPLFLRNYAQYLADVKHDYRKAEEFFQRAILASPSDGELLGQYAKMLWEVKHDTERAADYFERAVQAAPDNSYVMAAYASFLWSSEEEQDTTDFPTSFPSLVSAGLA